MTRCDGCDAAESFICDYKIISTITHEKSTTSLAILESLGMRRKIPSGDIHH